jgi:hypothetical protein
MNGVMPETITVREVLRLLREADYYPRTGNHDWVVAAHLETEALAKAATAVPAPDDPPEFRVWLETLQKQDISTEEREEIYWAMSDYFGEKEQDGA